VQPLLGRWSHRRHPVASWRLAAVAAFRREPEQLTQHVELYESAVGRAGVADPQHRCVKELVHQRAGDGIEALELSLAQRSIALVRPLELASTGCSATRRISFSTGSACSRSRHWPKRFASARTNRIGTRRLAATLVEMRDRNGGQPRACGRLALRLRTGPKRGRVLLGRLRPSALNGAPAARTEEVMEAGPSTCFLTHRRPGWRRSSPHATSGALSSPRPLASWSGSHATANWGLR
jgi:hypothetical protein